MLGLDTTIETAASPMGVGAVLMQKHRDTWYPIQYASCTPTYYSKMKLFPDGKRGSECSVQL